MITALPALGIGGRANQRIAAAAQRRWGATPASVVSSEVIHESIILAGGLGTRLSEETGTRPKPMVEIGGQPILWHIMKCFATLGVREFVICLGYRAT